MYVCSCFGITESQVKQHAAEGACTPRQIASQCRAGTDCGGCVRRIQSILGRGACPSRRLLDGPPDVAAETETGPGPVVAEPARATPVAGPAGPFLPPDPANPGDLVRPGGRVPTGDLVQPVEVAAAAHVPAAAAPEPFPSAEGLVRAPLMAGAVTRLPRAA